MVIMAAAVADFRPSSQADSKLKKGAADDALSRIDLVENPDILAETVRRRATASSARTCHRRLRRGNRRRVGDPVEHTASYPQELDLLMQRHLRRHRPGAVTASAGF